MDRVKVHYVPQGIGEIQDHLSMMMLSSPQFEDRTGLLPGRSIDTVFAELDDGLKGIRKKLGEESYLRLAELSAQMRTHFEADPEDRTAGSIKGRDCIAEMKDILRAKSSGKPAGGPRKSGTARALRSPASCDPASGER